MTLDIKILVKTVAAVVHGGVRTRGKHKRCTNALTRAVKAAICLPAILLFGASVTAQTGTDGSSTAKTPSPAALAKSIGYVLCKRAFDIVVSAVGLVIISPVLLLACIAIVLEDGASPFFLQPRIGKGCKPFRMVKLRSMRPDAEQVLERLSEEEKEEFSNNFKLKHDPRITKVGRFIRKTSIDELPQLWNVLKGDMSLVGPRPPLLAEEGAYGEHLERVMSVRPGITGYWQVHGRSETDFSERIELNEYYIDHRSLWTDIKILVKTVSVVVHGGGAY